MLFPNQVQQCMLRTLSMIEQHFFCETHQKHFNLTFSESASYLIGIQWDLILQYHYLNSINYKNQYSISKYSHIKMKKDKLTNRTLFFSPTVEAGWQSQSHITQFKLEEKLGSGSFGTVHKAVHKKTGRVYAIKQIKKAALDSNKLLQHAKTEVKIMYKLNHPNIIKLYNHFEDEVSIFLILQYAANGQLYNLLKSQPDKRLPESVAAPYIMQITQGIAEIHRNNIMHRDLKLQNILVDSNNNMKIADFGWSHFLQAEQKRNTYCGTLDYLAPEMVEKGHKHDNRVDIWSIGVLIYELCTGYSPFSCTLSGNQISIDNVKKNIKNLLYKMPKQLSPQCQDLIKNLLKKSPEQRLTIPQILSHAWLNKNKKNEGDKKQTSNDNWLQSLSKQMKEMFPEETINSNNVSKDGKYFTTEELYKYTRPDSVINLKPKKKKDQLSPVFNKKTEESAVTEASSVNSSQVSQKSAKVSQVPSFLNNSTFEYKKLSALQLKITELQLQHKNDRQQIERLRSEIMKNKQHAECKGQVRQLMDQILRQNKIMEQLNSKLSESERKVLMYEKQRRG